MSEEVIELSINETQALRAKLGLPPLRGVPGNSSSSSSSTSQSAAPHIDNNNNNTATTNNTNDEELVLSINETNALRAKIGLPPLKTNSSNDKAAGSSQSTAIHVVPTNTAATKEAKQRIEDATAKRLNANSIAALEKENSKFDDSKEGESALDFATKMLQSKNSTTGDGAKESGKGEKQKKKKRKKKLTSNPQLSLGEEEDEQQQSYTAADLQGIKVSHSTSDFIAGSTTVLTLADKSILDINPDTQMATNLHEDDDNELINANIDNDTQALANLKRKRQIELGAGRAGGYAGYDDDEFEELGGVGIAGPGGVRGGNGIGGAVSGGGKSGRGFAIGANGKAIDSSSKDQSKTDLFTSGAINLQSRNPSKVASDFMTHDDNDIEMDPTESREEKLEKERKKQQKILEKLRKKDSKKAKKAAKKKKKRRKVGGDESSDDDEREESGGGGSSSLLANLEATAVGNTLTKRRRQDVGDDTAMDDKDTSAAANVEKEDDMIEKRKRFDKIMEKGKARTDKAFNSSKPLIPSKSMASGRDDDDGDDDDAFLNAALAKARRLKRLKELSGGGNTNGGGGTVKREDAVVQAVAKLKQEEETKAKSEGYGSGEAVGKGGITFEFDEMQEFTRALRAREDQAKRTGKDGKGERSRRGVKATVPGSKDASTVKDERTTAADTKAQDDQVKIEDVDMEELAQGMEEEDNEEDETSGAFGTTAESAGVGRGMSNFLSMLNQTGEIKKHATKEEMRGRAKDKRTYEDYEQLDLQKVVNVDTNNAHEKDVELANREIKLEYRDDFGRLLTRKEAYRDMCYQFHGHGSSKKNQERRLKQIEREREEASMASRGGVGTLSSLKATQKATGKAFVVHKT